MQETAQEYTQRMLAFTKAKDPMKVLAASPKQLAGLLKRVPKSKLKVRPGPGKWSVTEILAHLADGEVVVGFRIRLVLGADGIPVQAFDQDAWAMYANYPKQDPFLSLEAYRINRERTLRLLKSVPRALWQNHGMHTERGKETVERMIQMLAGHDITHLNQVRMILRP